MYAHFLKHSGAFSTQVFETAQKCTNLLSGGVISILMHMHTTISLNVVILAFRMKPRL